MKIAHLSDCYLPRLGGIEMQVHDLALRQRADGDDVHIITATPDRGTAPVEPGDPTAAGLVVHRVTARLPWELPVHPRPFGAIRHLLQDERYDAVHVHTGVVSPFAWAGAPVAVRARVPTVVTLHCLWGPAAPMFRLANGPLRWSSWPAVLSAVSEVAAAPLRSIAGPDVEVAVLPNGIDPAQWRVEPVDRDPGDVRLVGVMRLAPRKRPLHLLRMLRRVRELVPTSIRLTATIIGEGPERRSLERYLRRHGMAGWVQLPGRFSRDRIRAVYRRADIFLAPANLESFGIAALEARCAGLPVVAKAQTGIRDFVEPGRNGLLANSDAEMAEAIARLARLPQLRADIGSHNRAVSPATSWDDVLKLTRAAYERAAALASPGAR